MNDLTDLHRGYKRSYAQLVEAVSHAIDRADPIGLLEGGAPLDEYGPEIGTIVPRLKTAANADEVQRILHEEFLRWFGEGIAGPKEAYYQAATEIWQALLKYRETAG